MLASGMIKGLTISGLQVNIELHRCISMSLISESGMREDFFECNYPQRGRCHQAWKRPQDKGSYEEDQVRHKKYITCFFTMPMK